MELNTSREATGCAASALRNPRIVAQKREISKTVETMPTRGGRTLEDEKGEILTVRFAPDITGRQTCGVVCIFTGKHLWCIVC
jgi:hypothetical protein